jgi:hypothetical protein
LPYTSVFVVFSDDVFITVIICSYTLAPPEAPFTIISLQHWARHVVAMFCPLCWLVVAFCMAMPIDTAMLEKVAANEPMVFTCLLCCESPFFSSGCLHM